MGNIRPKPGAKVSFGSWLIIDGNQPPPSPWTGEVIKYLGFNNYLVKRDADGETVCISGQSLRYTEGGRK